VEDYTDKMKPFFPIFAIAGILFSACSANIPIEAQKDYEGQLDVYSMYPADTRMWNNIFEAEEAYSFEAVPLGVIIPHHMIAELEISRFYKGLSEVVDPSVVVILAPNHYENGEANIQSCLTCVFQTIDGEVYLDASLTGSLINEGLAEENDEAFIQEHAIYTHTPFIKHYFSESKIMPILLQWEIPIEEVENLSHWLSETLPEDALVVASVDFSHYIPEAAADFHDQSSYTTLKNFDFDNIYDLEVDSPSSLYALLSLMEMKGALKSQRLAHTNLGQYMSAPVEESTTHQYFSFFEGESETVKAVSMMIFPDNTSDKLNFSDGWDWRENADLYPELDGIRGLEDRFLVGSDFLVFGLEEGCIDKRQNEMQSRFCGEMNYKKLEQQVQVDFVYMEAAGYDEAKKLIDENAANFVVIKGENDEMKFEYYNGSLIFNSLGDSPALVLGVYVTEDNFELYFFPTENTNEGIQLMDFENRKAMFQSIIGESIYPMESVVDEEKMMMKIERF
jgi:MEMO1 family protein